MYSCNRGIVLAQMDQRSAQIHLCQKGIGLNFEHLAIPAHRFFVVTLLLGIDGGFQKLIRVLPLSCGQSGKQGKRQNDTAHRYSG